MGVPTSGHGFNQIFIKVNGIRSDECKITRIFPVHWRIQGLLFACINNSRKATASGVCDLGKSESSTAIVINTRLQRKSSYSHIITHIVTIHTSTVITGDQWAPKTSTIYHTTPSGLPACSVRVITRMAARHRTTTVGHATVRGTAWRSTPRGTARYPLAHHAVTARCPVPVSIFPSLRAANSRLLPVILKST